MTETRGSGEGAVKVRDIETIGGLEAYFEARGQELVKESELVATVGGMDDTKLYVARVADDSGESYVHWWGSLDDDEDWGDWGGVTVHATREEALSEAREVYEDAVAMHEAARERRNNGGENRLLGDDPEWFVENVEQQAPATKDEAIRDALDTCRRFRAFVEAENSWEQIGLFASDRMQEIQWSLEAVAGEAELSSERA